MKKSLLALAAIGTLAIVPVVAQAQLSANVSLTTNYKFRGQDQDQAKTSTAKPALQGGFDYAHSSGFYVGNWNSTVDWLANNSLESDIYGGYKFEAAGLNFDVGMLAYLYPGASVANTTELYGGVTWGPVTAKYSHTVSSGYFGIGKPTGDGKGTGYFNLGIAQEVMKGLTLKASVGMTNFKGVINAAGVPDYTDYSVGATYDLGNGFSLTGALVGANKKQNYVYVVDPTKSVNKNTFVVTLTKSM